MGQIATETNTDKIERKSKKNMILGTIFGYLAIGVSIIYGLFLTPEIVDAVGESDYGLYGLTASITTMLLVDFGLTNTINTYLAKLRANNDKEGVEKFLAAIFKLYLMVDIVFVAVIAAIYFSAPFLFKETYTDPQIQTLRYLILIVGGFALISVPCSCFSAVMSTYEKFSMIKVVDIIQKVLYLAFSIMSVYLGWGVIGIVAVNVATGLLSVVIRFLYMRFYIGIKLDLRLGVSRKDLKSILSFSTWGLIITICSRLVITVTPFVLGVVSRFAFARKDAINFDFEVTLFSLVTTIETYIFMFGEMVSGFFLAKIARTDHEEVSEEQKKEHLQALVEKIGKIEFVVIGLILAGFVCVGQEFVLVWMKGKEEFLPIYWCIILICGYEIIHIPQLGLQNAMYTHGHIAPLAISQIAKAVVNLSLTFWLSSQYGAFGASIAICAACVTELIVNNIMFKKYLGISLLHFFGSIYLGGGITMAITIVAGLVLHFFMPLDYHMSVKLLVDGVIVVLVYIGYTLFFTFNKKERRYYLNTLRRLLRRPIKVYKEDKVRTSRIKKEIFISMTIITIAWCLTLAGGLVYLMFVSEFNHISILVITIYLAFMPVFAFYIIHKLSEAENKREVLIPIISSLFILSFVCIIVMLCLNKTAFEEIKREEPVAEIAE